MSDGANVGQAYIEVTAELRMAKAKAELKKHLNQMGREIDREFNKQQRELTGGLNKQMRALQKGQTKGLFAEQRAEMESWQKLQKQRDAALKSQDTQRQKAFEAEKRRISESVKSQKLLADQKQSALDAQKKAAETIGKAEFDAYAMERKRIEGIEKAHTQAFAMERKRMEAVQKAHIQALGLENKRIEVVQKAEHQAYQEYAKRKKIEDEDRRKADAYTKARGAGLSPHLSARYATGGLGNINPLATDRELRKLAKTATDTGSVMAKAFDKSSHTLSQLSTRIGLASFQLQLLGGFATTFVTGPAALLFGGMAVEGLKFAASIDYARASMKSLLKPGEDVEKILAQIRKMAIESPLFNTEDAISYAQKLAAVGVKGNDLYKSMQALSNIFLTQGVAGPERANLALMAYTQILSKGTIGMDDLRQQFAEHVPGGMKVFEEAAHILGEKTLEDLRDDMKAGKITAAQLNEAFIKLGNTPKYLEGATRSAQTLGGVWQAFNEDVQATLGMAFDKNRKEIIDAINGIKPVVMTFINEMVKALPTLIMWLGSLVVKAQELKQWWDNLVPAQKETVQQTILLGLAAGPAAIAIGILGTALSGVANAASLAMKAISLVGAPLTAIGGWVTVAVLAIAALTVALAYLYEKNEKVRLAVLRMLNLVKDYIQLIFLPVVDLLIGSVQSLETTFGFLGLKAEHLAGVLLILATPIALVTLALAALVVVIKAVQAAMFILTAIAYGLLQTVSFVLLGFQKIAELGALLSTGDRKEFMKGLADDIAGWRKAVGGLVGTKDVMNQWKGLSEANSHATEEWQSKLKNMDLTVTGLGGVMGNWNGILDQSIQKQMTLEDAINNARSAMQGQGNAARSLTDASDAYNSSLLTLKESIKANGRTLNEHSRQGQANRTALKGAAQASYEMMLQDIRSGVPMDKAIQRHKDRTKALKDEFGKNKETRAEADKLISSYGKVPKDVKTLLKMMGYTDVSAKMQEILAAQKVAANPGMKYSTALRNERKAWQIEKKDGLKGDGFATGGLIRGPGGPTGDKIPIMASDLEYMIQAKAARSLGKPVLDYINRTGQLPSQQFANGGQVTWPINLQMSGTKFPEMIGGAVGGGGMGWAKQMAVLRQRFPGLPLISGFRPGAMTSTGNRSYHALGRAVDIPPSWDVFQWIAENYGRSTKELIYTPAGGRQIKNGQLHRFSGGTIEQDHYNHIHWAYDNGGMIPPNAPFINKTGASELALNASQGDALQQKIENSDRPVNVTVYVDGVKRDAEIVFDEKAEQLIQALGGG